jgi:hypothetical protein
MVDPPFDPLLAEIPTNFGVIETPSSRRFLFPSGIPMSRKSLTALRALVGALVILNTAVLGKTATAGYSIPPTVSIDELASPVKLVPVSLIFHANVVESHSGAIAVTLGRTFVKEYWQSKPSLQTASSDVLRKTTSFPTF